jgi:sortase (surface protein transpeptidase)
MTRGRHAGMPRATAAIREWVMAAVVVGAAGALSLMLMTMPAPSPHPVADSHPPSAASRGASSTYLDPAAPTSAQSTAPPGESVSNVTIPAIGVDAPTELLGRDSSGALLPPTSFTDTGWYAAGVLPGEVGPAVIAGHIDSIGAPAVFARLDRLQPGAEVFVTLSTGAKLTFVVDHSIQVSKSAFPTRQVYGPTPDPELRLITCGGTFNPAIGHYDDNIVVFAKLAQG